MRLGALTFLSTVLFFFASSSNAAIPKLGPNGGIKKAFESVLQPGSFYAFGDFDIWNSNSFPSHFARILNSGDVDTSFVWTGASPDQITEDKESQKIWYCRTMSSPVGEKTFYVGSTTTNGTTVGSEMELKTSNPGFGCEAIQAIADALLVSAGDGIYYVDKGLKSAKQLDFKLFNHNPVSFTVPNGETSPVNIYIQYASASTGRPRLNRIDRLGNIDPTFQIEGEWSHDPAQVVYVKGKIRIYFSGHLYDVTGKQIAALDPTKLHSAKSNCKSFGPATLGPSGQTLILGILGGSDHNNCQEKFLGFSEVSMEDGSLLGERFNAAVSDRPLLPTSFLAPLDIAKGIYGVFTNAFDRPTWPAFSITYPDKIDSNWGGSEGVWNLFTRPEALPSSPDGSLPKSFFLHADGFASTPSAGLPHISLSSTGMLMADPGITFGEDVWDLYRTGILPFQLKDQTWLWFGAGRGYSSLDGKSLAPIPVLSGATITTPLFLLDGETRPFYFSGDYRNYVKQVDFKSGVLTRAYSGLGGDIKKIFPIDSHSALIVGGVFPCSESGTCLISSVSQLLKFDFEKNLISPDFQTWEYKIDSFGDRYGGYEISAIAGDPGRPGQFVIAGIHYGNLRESGKVFVGRIHQDGSADSNFWLEGLMDHEPTALLALVDGRVFVAGPIDSYGGDSVKNLFLIDSRGKLDPRFKLVQAPALSPTLAKSYSPEINGLYSIVGSSDILVFGEFSSLGSVTAYNIARVSATGELVPLWAPL